MFNKLSLTLLIAAYSLVASPLPLPAAQPGSAPTKLAMKACDMPGFEGKARCGTYEVFEDRAKKSGRTIKLNIVVLQALAPAPRPDPVFWFHGGPGAAATQALALARFGFLAASRKDHDIVFVDQRGTGKSNPLDCDIGDDPRDIDAFFGPLYPPEKIKACRKKLEPVADLRLYTTSIAMDDLDDVRAALGYGKINVAAASYGSIAAQVYMRQHPEHIRSVFMVGVGTTNVKQPLLFARAAQHAMDLTIEDCEADESCHKAFPEVRKEFETVVARIKNRPAEVAMINPSTRTKQNVKLDPDNFLERIRLLLYTTNFQRFVPFIIHRAFQNDFVPFEELSIAYNPGSIVARGMYFTVTCSEGVAFITPQDLIDETKGTFMGDYRVKVHQRACSDWPRGIVPESFLDPVKSDLPVLIISGEADGSTPPWFGETAVKSLTNGRQVKIRYYGHQIDSACVWGIFQKFVDSGSAKGIDTSCTEEIRRPPFAAALPPQFEIK